MRVLVTGGAGYIGTHTVIELIQAGHQVQVVDNLVNSKEAALEATSKIVGIPIPFEKLDLLDREALGRVCSTTLNLLEAMQDCGCQKIVFSSSATVYGEAQYIPIDEKHPCAPTNPYGRTKYFIEEILRDWVISDPSQSAVLLRYFNPVGAHPSGTIGEDPHGIPNNLAPVITQVAMGKRESLKVFGDDYDTPDGTGVRDYIHVTDLARAHVAAVEHEETGTQVFNLGTGEGASVMELLGVFSEVFQAKIPYEVVDRRPGDIAICVADPSHANEALGWKTSLGVREMCESALNWQSRWSQYKEKGDQKMTTIRNHSTDRMSQCVVHNGTVYLAGQVPHDFSGDIETQTQECLSKIEGLLGEVNSDKNHILSTTIYIKNIGDFAAMNSVWDDWIKDSPKPARACVEAEMAAPAILVEICVIAAVKD